MLRKILFSTFSACTIGLALAGCQNDHDSMSADKSMSSPMTKGDIIDVATGAGMSRVTTLVKAVQAADLVDTLKTPGPFTVFAPTNEAFAKLPAGTLDDLLKPENKQKLRSILLYHVVPGNHMASEVMSMKSATTAEGEKVWIKNMDGKVMVGNDKAWATVIKTDIHASNGTIHWVDTVLMP